MLDLEFAELSDAGLTRDHNEDYLGHVLPSSPVQVQSQGWLFALADGVGGQERGEVASRLAIETVQAGFRKTHADMTRHAKAERKAFITKQKRAVAHLRKEFATDMAGASRAWHGARA